MLQITQLLVGSSARLHVLESQGRLLLRCQELAKISKNQADVLSGDLRIGCPHHKNGFAEQVKQRLVLVHSQLFDLVESTFLPQISSNF